MGYFGFMVIGKYPAVQTFFNPDKNQSNLLSGKFWTESLKNPEVIKRVLITIGIFAVYKLLYLIPTLRRKFFSDGEIGRKSIAKTALIFSLILCVVQSFFITLWLEKQFIYDVSLVLNPGWGFRMVALVSLTAVFCFTLWLARIITDKGIANGFAVLIVFDMAVKFALSVFHIAKESMGGILLVALLIPVVWLALHMTLWQRKVPVRVKGGDTSLVLRLSWFARQPLSWAFSLLLLPATIASFVPMGAIQTVAGLLLRGSLLYYLLIPVLVMATAFIYKRMVFNSDFLINLLKKYEGQVMEGSAEPEMKAMLNGMVNKVVLYISLMCIVFAVLPDSIMAFLKVQYAVASLFGGAAIFVIVGLLYDVSERIGALLQAQESGCQSTCYVAFTENEAIIKKAFLEQGGIACVIEPIRFTWGMPIRTPIDEYRLNVAKEHSKSARDLL